MTNAAPQHEYRRRLLVKVQASHSSTTRMKNRHRAADTKAFLGRKGARHWIERDIDVAHEELHISESLVRVRL